MTKTMEVNLNREDLLKADLLSLFPFLTEDDDLLSDEIFINVFTLFIKSMRYWERKKRIGKINTMTGGVDIMKRILEDGDINLSLFLQLQMPIEQYATPFEIKIT